jgi:hypothetical protein
MALVAPLAECVAAAERIRAFVTAINSVKSLPA